MSSLVLDTNIVSYLMRGHSLAAPYHSLIGSNTLCISFMTVAEMFEGAKRAGWGAAKWARLNSILLSYVVIPSSPNLCRLWGEVRFARRHQPISGEDAWIAATALATSSPLVTHNVADFNGIAGLQVLTVTTP